MLAAMSDSQTMPVDLSHLARYTGGERALNVEILRLFDNQLTEMVEKLKAMLERRDTRGWHDTAHTIKGAARGVGAFSVGDAAAAAEPVDPLLQHDKAAAAIANLCRQGDAAQAFIRDYLAA
jgi:HPt (histidine-containing phosphotransfer) domain-containing protein